MQTTQEHRPVGQSQGIRGRLGDFAGWVVLIIATLGFLLPFYLLLRNSLATRKDVTAVPWTVFPSDPQWQNFTELFTGSEIPMASSMMNSAIIAISTTVGTLLICSMAGYALARIPSKFAKPIFYLVLATLMIPAAVPSYPASSSSPASAGCRTSAASSSPVCSADSRCSCVGSTSSPSQRP